MAWAIFTTPEDKDRMASAFVQAGLSQGEWNRIRDYAQAFLDGWNANVVVPAEHPCYPFDGPDGTWLNPETGEVGPIGANYMRVVVMTHGTKAGWVTELTRLVNRPQQDRLVLRPYLHLMTVTPWYAVEAWPAPAGFFSGMVCG